MGSRAPHEQWRLHGAHASSCTCTHSPQHSNTSPTRCSTTQPSQGVCTATTAALYIHTAVRDHREDCSTCQHQHTQLQDCTGSAVHSPLPYNGVPAVSVSTTSAPTPYFTALGRVCSRPETFPGLEHLAAHACSAAPGPIDST